MLVKIYDDSNLLEQATGTRRRGGYDGLEQGCKPNVYDAIQLTNKIWDENIDEVSILKCWTKASCMPLAVTDEVQNEVNVAEENNHFEEGISVEDDDLYGNGFVDNENYDEFLLNDLNPIQNTENYVVSDYENADSLARNGEDYLPTNDVRPSARTYSDSVIANLPQKLIHLRQAVMRVSDDRTSEEFAGTILTADDINAENIQHIVQAWDEVDLNQEEGMDERVEEIYDDLQLDLEMAMSELTVKEFQKPVEKGLGAGFELVENDHVETDNVPTSPKASELFESK